MTPVDVSHYSYEPMACRPRVNAGIPLTDDFAENPEGFNRLDVTVGNGRRSEPSTARAYLHPAMQRPNLYVMTNALSSRIVVEKGRAIGIEYAHKGHEFFARATREVILSGGSYNSPQLLLLSGIGPADEIAAHGIKPVHESPRCRQENLSEHPIALGMRFLTPLSDHDTFVQELRFDRLAVQAIRYALFRTGHFGNQVITANAFIRTRPELDTPNMQLFFAPVSFTTKVWMPGIRKMERSGLGGSVCLLRPESRGHVTLRSANPTDSPKVTLNFMKERADRDATREGLKMLRQVYNTAPLSDIVKREVMPGPEVTSNEDLDAYIRKMASMSAITPSARAAMGVNDDAVVDPNVATGHRAACASSMQVDHAAGAER